jgi:hypothetical protein
MENGLKFWDVFEEALFAQVEKNPAEYALGRGQSAADYAHKTRVKMEDAGVSSCTLSTPAFRALAKRFGIKPTRAALIEREAVERRAAEFSKGWKKTVRISIEVDSQVEAHQLQKAFESFLDPVVLNQQLHDTIDGLGAGPAIEFLDTDIEITVQKDERARV